MASWVAGDDFIASRGRVSKGPDVELESEPHGAGRDLGWPGVTSPDTSISMLAATGYPAPLVASPGGVMATSQLPFHCWPHPAGAGVLGSPPAEAISDRGRRKIQLGRSASRMVIQDAV